MAMEAWLAELEMDAYTRPSLINSHYHQCKTMEATFPEQLTATVDENFLNPYTAESNSSSPELWDINNIIVDQFTSPPHQNSNNNENNKNNNNNNYYYDNNVDIIGVGKSQIIKEDINNNQAGKRGAKRKRVPSQVQDHILAERRRRELLSQMFISLSALIPGLRKMDKTSILGEAIKHMKQLQDKVKTLEEVVAKNTIESAKLFKKSELVVSYGKVDDICCSTVDDNGTHVSSGGNGGSITGGRDIDNNAIDSLPEIEVRISGNTLLLKVYCQNKKQVLTKLFEELQKHELSVTNTSVIPFESLALDITIVAQMQRGLDMNAKNFVRNLRTAFR